MTGLSPQGAQFARCVIAGDFLSDHLHSALLDDLRSDPTDEARWHACLAQSLSTGEKVAVGWLAKRVWPSGAGDWWPSGCTWEDVAVRCDAGLVRALAVVGDSLTRITAMEDAA